MKNELERNGNTADHMEERISKLKDRNLEMIQVEEEKQNTKKVRKFHKTYPTHLERKILG